MRETALDMVYELAKKDKRIFFVGSDLGVGTLKKFKEEMPDRFLMEGVRVLWFLQINDSPGHAPTQCR